MENHSIHEGHRERLKEQFLKNGLPALTPYQALELLLFYAIPRKDTNPLAHKLLDTFGSVSGVFDAAYEELCRVPGMTHNAAVLVTLTRQTFQAYYKDRFKAAPRLNSVQQAAELIVPRFVGERQERVFLVCLDPRCSVLYADFVSEGDSTCVPLSARTVVALAIRCNAAAVILAHNHPGAYAIPSADDIVNTRELSNMLHSVNVMLLDHLIIPGVATAPEDLDLEHPRLEYVSMRESPSLAHLFPESSQMPSALTRR